MYTKQLTRNFESCGWISTEKGPSSLPGLRSSNGSRPAPDPEADVWFWKDAAWKKADDWEDRWVIASSGEMICGVISFSALNGLFSPTLKSRARLVVRFPGSTSTVSPAAMPLKVKMRTSHVVRMIDIVFGTEKEPRENWYGLSGLRLGL